jgi:DNA-binding NarL/FixJ family response regulator
MPDTRILAEVADCGLLGQGGVRVLMLTTFDLDEYVEPALRLGAGGFLLKTMSYEQLFAGVRAVADGGSVLAPEPARRLVGRYLSEQRARVDPRGVRRVADLTAREREVLHLVARGRSNVEIAGQLFISEHTVKTHFGNLLLKTGSRDRAELIVLAYDAGLVAPGG